MSGRKWSQQEDSQLLDQMILLTYRNIRWDAVCKVISGRSAQSCRERWKYLQKCKEKLGNLVMTISFNFSL